MAKPTKSEGGIADMIHEEVGSVHVQPTLDNLMDAGETKPVAVGDDDEDLHEPTRVVRMPGAALSEITASLTEPGRMTPLPQGMKAHFEGKHGATWEITKALTIIGRVATVADLVFEDDELSRHHAALSFRGGVFYIEDLDSTNGTFVNGRRIKKTHLKPGDEVRVGQQEIRLIIENDH